MIKNGIMRLKIGSDFMFKFSWQKFFIILSITTAVIIISFGVTNLKEDSNTEEQISDTSKCETGYIEQDNMCLKTLSKEKEKVLQCSEGYHLVNETCVYEVEYPINTNYHCPEGYELSGKSCSAYTEKIDASFTTACPEGYTEDKIHVCEKKQTMEISKELSCLDGYYYINSQCVKPSYTESVVCNYMCYCPTAKFGTQLYDASTTTCYYGSVTTPLNLSACPEGWRIDYDANVCYKTERFAATFTYHCPEGYDLYYGSCYKKNIIDANKSYSCSNGSMENGKCISRFTEAPIINYFCEEGYEDTGSKCEKQIIKEQRQ